MKRKYRPSLSILLIVVLLLSIFPLYNDFSTVFAENECGYTGYIPPYTEPCSSNGYQFNEPIWRDLGLKVYGTWEAIPIRRNNFKPSTLDPNTGKVTQNKGSYKESGYTKSGNGEYRYHGFDVNGALYSNINFENDIYTENDKSKKRWIYQPWNQPINTQSTERYDIAQFENGIDNIQAIKYLNEELGFKIANGLNYTTGSRSYNNDVHDYMYVYHMPDLKTFGSGTMWHQSPSSGKVWYETFNLPKVDDRLTLPVEVTIDVLDPEPISLKNYLGQSQIPVKVKVTGILQDQDYFGDDAGEFSYYTRKDIEEWTLEIGGKSQTVKPVANTGVAEFTIQVPMNKIDEVEKTYLANATATATFTNNATSLGNGDRIIQFADAAAELVSLFTVQEMIQFENKSEFTSNRVNYKDASIGDIVRYDIAITNTDSGESQIFTYNTSKVNDATVNNDLHTFMISYFDSVIPATDVRKEFRVDQTITIQNGKTDTYTKSIVVYQTSKPISVPGSEPGPIIEWTYVMPDMSVPNYGFDVVPVDIRDNTDMTHVEGVKYYIDGQQVSESELFGGYTFGIGEHGFHKVEGVYQSTSGLVASQVEWIMILDTKPRAQFDIDGPYKENRKMTLTDETESVNNQMVLDNYPINNYQWKVTTNEGKDLRFKTNTDNYKEFLSNTEGVYRIEVVVANTLGRISDPYVNEFAIMKDHKPAVALHPFDGQMARGENVRLMYDAVSIDEDLIESQKVDVYYDSNNDGTFDQLVETLDTSLNGIEEYTPKNGLGKYKMVATAVETFGQETIPELLDGTEKRDRVFETYFMVDNYQPTSTVYIDQPYVLPEIDAYYMLDRDLDRAKNDYIEGQNVTISNMMKDEHMDAKADSWDMYTYTYITEASTTRNTGGSYPSSTRSYSSGGYSGTLDRYRVRNDQYTRDEGEYKTKTESKTATASCSNRVTEKWYADGGYSHSGANECPSSKSVSSGGYSGSIPRTGTSGGSKSCSTSSTGTKTCKTTWRASYSGTITKQTRYWDSDYVTYNDYTGYYSGTLYKYVREDYNNRFFRTTSDKYIVYISDSNINQINDLNMVSENNDAKLILVGQTGMKSQIAHDHFILNDRPIEEITEEVIQYIADNNPAIPKYTVLLNETYNLYFAQYDDEGDTIARKESMYIQDKDYYDNSTGLESFAIAAYGESEWINETKRTSFTKPGKFTIMRRIMDQPSTNPALSQYNYYSNESKIDVYAHRKPIALAELDWDYNESTNTYKTTWVDKSYDLDHEFTHLDKGIVDRKIKYKENSESLWSYQIPDELEPGSYTLEYVVKDLEGAWSLPFVFNFTLQPAPPVQLNAKAQTIDTTYTLNSVPASERLRLYDIWTRYPYSHYLSVQLYQGGTAKTTETRVNYYTGTKSGNDINWNNINHTIPSTLPDGNYNFRITAIGQGGNTAVMNFPATVNTPINLVPNFPNEVTVGDTYATRAVTSKYVNATRVTFWKGTGYQTTIDLTGTTSGYNKNWTRNYAIPSMPDGNYIVEYQSTTPNGKVQTRQLTVKVINNTPPTAAFELYANKYNRQVPPRSVFEGDTLLVTSTAYDPDINNPNQNDYMTWRYELTYPDGTTDVFTEEDPSFRVLQIGTHRLVQTVTDSYGKADSITQTFVVGLLEITGQVSHTDNWLEIHNKQGNNTNVEFYSGERFMLEADATVHDIESVRVYFEGVQVNEGTLNLTTDLSQVGPQSKIWNGSLSDNRMTEARSRLEDGRVQFTFVVKYTNGIEKTDEINVQIIGSVYDPLNYHRSN